MYFESLVCIINTIEDRFEQEDFRTYVKLENVLLKAVKGDVSIQEFNNVMALCSSDFHENTFQLQLETFQVLTITHTSVPQLMLSGN